MKIPLFIETWALKRLPPCREITVLASLSMDTVLSLRERLRLRLHLFFCTMCKRYFDQIRLMRNELRNKAEDPRPPANSNSLPPETRDRIKKSLG